MLPTVVPVVKEKLDNLLSKIRFHYIPDKNGRLNEDTLSFPQEVLDTTISSLNKAVKANKRIIFVTCVSDENEINDESFFEIFIKKYIKKDKKYSSYSLYHSIDEHKNFMEMIIRLEELGTSEEIEDNKYIIFIGNEFKKFLNDDSNFLDLKNKYSSKFKRIFNSNEKGIISLNIGYNGNYRNYELDRISEILDKSIIDDFFELLSETSKNPAEEPEIYSDQRDFYREQNGIVNRISIPMKDGLLKQVDQNLDQVLSLMLKSLIFDYSLNIKGSYGIGKTTLLHSFYNLVKVCDIKALSYSAHKSKGLLSKFDFNSYELSPLWKDKHYISGKKQIAFIDQLDGYVDFHFYNNGSINNYSFIDNTYEKVLRKHYFGKNADKIFCDRNIYLNYINNSLDNIMNFISTSNNELDLKKLFEYGITKTEYSEKNITFFRIGYDLKLLVNIEMSGLDWSNINIK